jgi:transposase
LTHEKLINRLFELQDTNFTVVDVQRKKELIEVKIWHKKKAHYICSRCGAKHSGAHDFRDVIFWDLPLGNQSVKLIVRRARVSCACQNKVCVESIPFRSRCHRLSKRMVQYCESLLCTKMFTVSDVARMLNLNYDTVYKIDHRILQELVQHLEIPSIKRIGVDEKSFLKGQKYVTVVSCLDRGKALWVSSGRSEESLNEFFRILGPERTKDIELVTRDEHKPYAKSIHKNAPKAIQISDKFHVIKHLNECIDRVRREEGIQQRGLMWCLRKRSHNQNEKNEVCLKKLKKDNNILYELYLLKEEFFRFFDYKNYETNKAEDFMLSWMRTMATFGIEPINDFLQYLQRHLWSILNIVRLGFTNATCEGINRKINVLKSMAYGYKNVHYFKLKILQRCGLLGSLYDPGTHTMS